MRIKKKSLFIIKIRNNINSVKSTQIIKNIKKNSIITINNYNYNFLSSKNFKYNSKNNDNRNNNYRYR